MSAQDDNMRLVAEVVDKFSTPLKNLRSGLQQMGREGAQHADAVQKSFGRVESAAKVAGQTVGTVLNPALAAVGITGLTAAGAVAAVGTALRGFSSATSQLVYLSRETGIATDKLRELEALGGKVGLAPEAMAGSIQRFAENARAIKKGVGEISGFLQSQNPVVARWASELQKDLQAGLDPAEAYKRSLKFMQAIRDPIEKGIFAERVLGNKALARLGFEDVDKLVAEIQREIGKLPKDAEKNALAFERAIDGMGQSLRSLRDIIGAEIAPVITEMTNDVAHFVQENREGFRVSVVESIRAVRDALKEVDWKETKEAAGAVFGAIADGARQTGTVIRSMALTLGALKDLKDGNFSEAFRKFGEVDRATDLGMGRRSNAEPSQKPSAKDEALDAMLRGQSPAGVADARRKADITAVERELRTKQDELGYQQRRFPIRDEATVRKLTEEVGKLSSELKRLREAMPDKKPGEATAQQSSAEGDGPFGGAKVQTAALGGGFGAMARLGRSMGGHGGRGGFYGGGSHDDEGSGGGGAGGGAGIRPGGPGERVGRRMRGHGEGAPSDTGPRLKSQGPVPKGMDERAQRVMARLIARGWTPEAAASAVGQAVEESSVRSDGPLGDTKRFGTGDAAAHGMFQWRDGRFRALKKFAGERGKPWTDFDTQVDFFDEERKRRSPDERSWHKEVDVARGNRTGKKFEVYGGPLQHQRERHARRQLEIWRRRKTALPDAEDGPAGQDRSKPGPHAGEDFDLARRFYGGKAEPGQQTLPYNERFGRLRNSLRRFRNGATGLDDADGALGETARQRAQDEKDMRGVGRGFRAIPKPAVTGNMRKAMQAQMGGGRGDVSGMVQVNVAKPGPDTRVSTSTSGTLFREVKLNGGRTMARASETA